MIFGPPCAWNSFVVFTFSGCNMLHTVFTYIRIVHAQSIFLFLSFTHSAEVSLFHLQQTPLFLISRETVPPLLYFVGVSQFQPCFSLQAEGGFVLTYGDPVVSISWLFAARNCDPDGYKRSRRVPRGCNGFKSRSSRLNLGAFFPPVLLRRLPDSQPATRT